MNSVLSVPTHTADVTQYWKAIHARAGLALHAALYTGPAAQIEPGCVLDLGCEAGFGPLLISQGNPALRVVGLDVDRRALAFSQQLPKAGNVSRLAGDAFRLPVACNSFTGVFAINLLNLLERPVPVLLEIRRVLKPGGVAVIGIPAQKSLTGKNWCADNNGRLPSEMDELFADVIYPGMIWGQLPGLPPRAFYLDQAGSRWMALCKKEL